MGFRENTLNLTMRLFLSVLFCGAALALPNGRVLRPEEHWRPAAARDISKYTPRHALVNARSSPNENSYVEFARSIKSSSQSKSTHKASVYDLHPRTKLLVDSRLSQTSGHGKWPCSLTTPGSV